MAFVVILYLGIIYMVFFKFRLLPWNKISQGITELLATQFTIARYA